MRRACLAVLMLIILSAPAYATDVEYTGHTSLGVTGGYMGIPGALLSLGFERYRSISAAYYGLKTSIDYGQFDLTFTATNWNLFISDGIWRERGATEPNGKPDYYLIKTSLGMVSVDSSILWKFRIVKPFGMVVGPGLGFGVVYGKIEEKHVNSENPVFKRKNIPPVLPVLIGQGGCRFYPIDEAVIALDFGFRDGLFIGAGFEYFF